MVKELQKDIKLWYSRLQGRGKIIAGLAAVGATWLLVQLIMAIAGVGLSLGIIGFILNLIAITLVSLILVQFFMMRKMQKDYEANMKQAMMKGRRSGNRMEQVAGRRNRGSMRRAGGGNSMSSAIQMATQVDAESLDKHYRPKLRAKATLVEDWKEIVEPGIYALNVAPKAKVEIIDAADLGGGFFVAKYSPDGILKERRFMTHRQSGEPLRFGTMRNVKQALSGKSSGKGNRRRKKKK